MFKDRKTESAEAEIFAVLTESSKFEREHKGFSAAQHSERASEHERLANTSHAIADDHATESRIAQRRGDVAKFMSTKDAEHTYRKQALDHAHAASLHYIHGKIKAGHKISELY